LEQHHSAKVQTRVQYYNGITFLAGNRTTSKSFNNNNSWNNIIQPKYKPEYSITMSLPFLLAIELPAKVSITTTVGTTLFSQSTNQSTVQYYNVIVIAPLASLTYVYQSQVEQ
jgi:hypothetical protein